MKGAPVIYASPPVRDVHTRARAHTVSRLHAPEKRLGDSSISSNPGGHVERIDVYESTCWI
jgi:hypothetical protein